MISIEELTKVIDEVTAEVKGKDTEGNFRLPVDRVFTAPGFGTVVTGTIISGRIREGEIVEIYPAEIISKIKGIQVHEIAVQFAEAGQRCALNISNVKVQDIKRGFVISKENVVEPSLFVDCSLYYLKSAQKPLINRQRVKLYHGTEEILCRVVILDKEEVKPGEKVFVQLRLEKPVTAQKNDKYVIRSYSPMSTIGGGTIINPRAKKIKAFDIEYINELKLKENGSIENIIENIVEKFSSDFPSEFDIMKALGKKEEKASEILQTLISERRIIKLIASDRAIYIHVNYLKSKIEEVENVLEKYHRENPLKLGMSKEELKSRVFNKSIKQKTFDELLFLLQHRNIIKIANNFIALLSFIIVYTEEQQQVIQLFKKEYKDAMQGSSKYEELLEMSKNKKLVKSVFDHLLDIGEMVKVTEDCFMLSDYYERAKHIIISYIKSKQSISVAEGRDILHINRKYSVALLEHFDAIKLTKRMEDKRVLY